MSKIYEALKRLEWERTANHAGKQGTRPDEARGSGAWWTGALVGCVVGFGMGIVAMTATPARWQPLAPPETPAVAPTVAHALPLAEAPALPPPPSPAAVDTPAAPAVETPPPPAVEAMLPAAVETQLPSAEVAVPAPPADAPSARAAVVVDAPADVPEPAAAPALTPYTIQVASFRDPANAARLAARLEARAHRVTVEPDGSDDSLWVVRVGGYADRSEAETVRAGLELEGFSGLRVSKRSPRDDSLRHTRASVGD
jgi:hypothetical protein